MLHGNFHPPAEPTGKGKILIRERAFDHEIKLTQREYEEHTRNAEAISANMGGRRSEKYGGGRNPNRRKRKDALVWPQK